MSNTSVDPSLKYLPDYPGEEFAAAWVEEVIAGTRLERAAAKLLPEDTPRAKVHAVVRALVSRPELVTAIGGGLVHSRHEREALEVLLGYLYMHVLLPCVEPAPTRAHQRRARFSMQVTRFLNRRLDELVRRDRREYHKRYSRELRRNGGRRQLNAKANLVMPEGRAPRTSEEVLDHDDETR